MRDTFLNQRGSMVILFVLLLGLLAAIAGLALDVGLVSAQKSILQNAVDSAVLAGANKLPSNAAEAVSTANAYAAQNNVSGAEITKMQVSAADPCVLEGAASRQVPSIFGKLTGYTDGYTVNVLAAAKVWPLGSGVGGVVPFGVKKSFYDAYKNAGDLILKFGAGDGVQGDYGAVRRQEDHGAKDYEENIMYGFDTNLSIGDPLWVENGNMSGPTFDGVDFRIDNNQALCVVPIVQEQTSGAVGEWVVVGFAMFELTGIDGKGTDNNVHGRFVQEVWPGDITTDPTKNFGAYSTHPTLIQ